MFFSQRISTKDLVRLTNVDAERNIYTHPNFIARDIFWQRLEGLDNLIKRNMSNPEISSVLDFGGGSGVFLRFSSPRFERVDIVDLDVEDAHRIKKNFDFDNVRIINHDITQHQPCDRYEAVVAADVLEHFEDLQPALDYISQALKSKGLLFVSLPTENWLYELGRTVVRKEKPVDHYHSANAVIRTLEAFGFELVQSEFAPKYIFEIPLFLLGVLRKK